MYIFNLLEAPEGPLSEFFLQDARKQKMKEKTNRILEFTRRIFDCLGDFGVFAQANYKISERFARIVTFLITR